MLCSAIPDDPKRFGATDAHNCTNASRKYNRGEADAHVMCKCKSERVGWLCHADMQMRFQHMHDKPGDTIYMVFAV